MCYRCAHGPLVPSSKLGLRPRTACSRMQAHCLQFEPTGRRYHWLQHASGLRQQPTTYTTCGRMRHRGVASTELPAGSTLSLRWVSICLRCLGISTPTFFAFRIKGTSKFRSGIPVPENKNFLKRHHSQLGSSKFFVTFFAKTAVLSVNTYKFEPSFL